MELGSLAIPGMPLFIEAVALGGGPDEDVKIGVIGGGCDELTMSSFDGLPFVWFVEWDPTQGNRVFEPYDGISLEDGICSNWPPQNPERYPSPVMGGAAILDVQETPQLIFRAVGGMGVGMPQDVFWMSVFPVSGSSLDTKIPAYFNEPEPFIPGKIIPLGAGPLVMAQSNVMGAWTIWSPYDEEGATSVLFPGSDLVDVVPDGESLTEFILSSASLNSVTLSTLTCNLDAGGNPDAERCSPPRNSITLDLQAPVFDAKIVSVPDPSSQAPSVILVTVEGSPGGDVVRARLVRLNGDRPCLGGQDVLELAPPTSLAGAIGELKIGSRAVPGLANCVDVVVAASQGDFLDMGPGSANMVWASGFRACQP